MTQHTLFSATKLVQDALSNPGGLTAEERRQHALMLTECMAGAPWAIREVKERIRHILESRHVTVPHHTTEQMVEEIFRYAYGLDILEDLVRDPEVDEIRVNGPDKVFVQRRGRNERVDIRFKDAEHVRKTINKLLLHDNVSLDLSTQRVESTRRDGIRVTAAIPPFAAAPTVVIRKAESFDATPENLIHTGTVNERLLAMLALLPRGRVNVLISGGTGTGKTTLLRFLFGYLDPRLRAVTLETDFELHLDRHYPDRDIVALAEQPTAGITLKRAFTTVLRLTPDVIIVGEARSTEAEEMLKACLRGHEGSMGTIHASSVPDAIDSMAFMVVDEGKQLPLPFLRLQVARAFNVVVQMFGDSRLGIRRVERLAEVYVQEDRVCFRDLALWRGTSEDYNQGDWEFPDKPTDRLVGKLIKFGVSQAELEAVGWV